MHIVWTCLVRVRTSGKVIRVVMGLMRQKQCSDAAQANVIMDMGFFL